MSFLNKIKSLGQPRKNDADSDELPQVQSYGGAALAPLPDAGLPHGGYGSTVSDASATTMQLPLAGATSILSEEAPSELADFSESRLQGAELATAAAGSGLPFIGNRPAEQQQRILGALIAIGVLGLVVTVSLSLLSASRGSAQVAASGEAMMQSQRLAKSVSQALIGSPLAFPEVRESSEVLSRSVRGLKTGEGGLSAAPAAVQELLDPMLPLVDRAEKNVTP